MSNNLWFYDFMISISKNMLAKNMHCMYLYIYVCIWKSKCIRMYLRFVQYFLGNGKWCKSLCRLCGKDDPPRSKFSGPPQRTAWVSYFLWFRPSNDRQNDDDNNTAQLILKLTLLWRDGRQEHWVGIFFIIFQKLRIINL